ncbi:hypothetical protein OG588_15480 [Streptomyces prunicolor]|uniref:hypothetical protein n=1 Tax=Streptomyces prunicolor TaxID=67348 RepID=UPI00386FC1BD|nr:hypothetical protein OG588_15480 [Streptomyces prunicolor]
MPTALRTELAEAAHREGARLHCLPPRGADGVLSLTREAEHRNTTDADRATDSRRWVAETHDSGLGIPAQALGLQDSLERVPVRDFGAHRHRNGLTVRPFEQRPSNGSCSSRPRTGYGHRSCTRHSCLPRFPPAQ